MAMIHNLPPQAYTRDVLVKAIDWMATQPATTRERGLSADSIVSLYLQARRRNSDWQNEAPVSGENFKSDLKNLAQDLKQFEEPSSPHHTGPAHDPIPIQPHLNEAMARPIPNPAPQPPPQPKSPVWNIDSRSLSAAREVQYRLNLSSETEAIRFLVTLGLERARQMFP